MARRSIRFAAPLVLVVASTAAACGDDGTVNPPGSTGATSTTNECDNPDVICNPPATTAPITTVPETIVPVNPPAPSVP